MSGGVAAVIAARGRVDRLRRLVEPDQMRVFWTAASAGAFLVALWVASGTTGILYALVYAVAITPGVVLGCRLLGPRHPAGWIVGGVLGYGATQLALWLPVFAGMASAPTFLAIWLVQAAVLVWAARRIPAPVLQLAPASAADLRALALTLLLVPILMGPPYRNLGAADDTGTRYYRAYFTADFVWHTALAAELGRYASPPKNPYMASRDMHYYWTYFLLPAVVAHEAPPPLDDLQRVLKANAMLSALLVVGMLFVLTRTAVPSAGVAALAVMLGVLAASAEGSFVLQQLWRAGRPWAALTDMNIDAITAWQFDGLRIDGIARGLWYNPQHSVACALGLVSTLAAATAGAGASRGAIWLSGAALGLATTFNPFVGAVFSLIYGAAVIIDAAGGRDPVRVLLRHAEAAVPVIAALAWSFLNEVAEGAGDAVRISGAGFTRPNALTSLLLSTGPILLPALAGLWPWRGLPAQPARAAAAGAALAVILMHTVTLSDASWVGFRTGQILLLMLPVLLARLLWVLAARGLAWPFVVSVLIVVAGLPTTIIDTYNAQDITNRRLGPGRLFHWTLSVTPDQQAAFEWVRRSLPEDAVVQMEPVLRGREHWSLIPTFAQRRMSAGLPISLLPMPEYAQRSAEVQQLYRTADPREAWQLARARRIDYLYVDAKDAEAYPGGVAKFDSQPAYFQKVFENGEVRIYDVQ
jgi:hypothetical protein